jgi:hypothetical protein
MARLEWDFQMSYPPRRLFSLAFLVSAILLMFVIVVRLDSYHKQLLAFPLLIFSCYQYWHQKNNGPTIAALFTRYCGLATSRLIMRTFHPWPRSEPPTTRQRLKTTVVSTIYLCGFASSAYFLKADLNWYILLLMVALAVNFVAWVVDWPALLLTDGRAARKNA